MMDVFLASPSPTPGLGRTPSSLPSLYATSVAGHALHLHLPPSEDPFLKDQPTQELSLSLPSTYATCGISPRMGVILLAG
jgi:hypothetical protein